jgi:pyrimidine operon attenuation protein/uracil phosphoribosyltransferase
METRKVLDSEAINVIVHRMAHQVYEQFCDYDELILLGVDGEGFFLAEQLKAELDQMNLLRSRLFKLSLPKHEKSKPGITFSPALPNLKGIPVLLVDDVLNSGRTLTYCLSPLVEYEIPSLKIAVLVERKYRKFPVASSITGLELSTTLEENVLAVLDPEKGEVGVFLN